MPWFALALESAKEWSLIRWLPAAYHDLALCAQELGERDLSRRYASVAVELYHPRSPRVTSLIADMSLGEKGSREAAGYALACWRGALVASPDPRDVLYACGNLAEAAAHLGLLPQFAGYVADMWSAYRNLPDKEGAALALVCAGDAALTINHYADAAEMGEEAARVALERGEEVVLHRALDLTARALAKG